MSRAPEPAPKIVLIGGGTGSFTLLQSLKQLTPNITALVSMADDGGSTGVLRDELGVLPPGDVRQCLVGLSEAPQELRDLFNFRFPKGTFEGHSFGNLFLSAVESMTDNFSDAVRMAGEVLRITGRVLPVTLQNTKLVLHQSGVRMVGEDAIGEQDLVGQTNISSTQLDDRPQLSLEPQAAINPEARQAVLDADLIIISAGDLYTSIAPALIVEGMGQALRETSAKIVYVCNLVNKAKHTADFSVDAYATEVERFIGAPVLDAVFYNVDVPEDDLLHKYALEGEYPVLFDQAQFDDAHYEAIPGNFLSRSLQKRNANDTRIKRSLIRHDGEAIKEAIAHYLETAL